MTWNTVKYDGQIDFSKFTCDEPILNDYLHNKAVQEQENDLCKFYFLVNEQDEIGGFYVLSAGSIRRQELPTAKARKNLPGYPLGTIHIGRLARHKEMVKQKLGDLLMLSALEVAVGSSKVVAVYAVTVDAKNKRAEDYYLKFGFRNLLSDPAKANEFPKSMYIKISEARHMISGKPN